MTGPTPPGTGVRAAATLEADGRSTSPTIAPSTTLMPQSTTTTPGSEHRSMHQPGTASSHHQDVGSCHFRGEVAGLPMADRDGGVMTQE